MASGAGSQIALLKTSSLYYTPVSADFLNARWTNFVSENLEHQLQELAEGSITGRYGPPASAKGIDFAQGQIVLQPNPNALGNYAYAVAGVLTSSTLCAAGSTGANSGSFAGMAVRRHLITPRTQAYDSFAFLEPWAALMYKDVGSMFVMGGTLFHGIEFDITAGQLVQVTVDAMTRKVTRTQRTSAVAALVSSGGRPWTWDMASVQVGQPDFGGLAASTKYEKLVIKFNVPIEGVVLLDGNTQYAEFQLNGFRSVEVSGTVSFRDQTEYDAFVAYQNRSLRVYMQNVNSALQLGDPANPFYFAMQLDIPQIKYLSVQQPVQGPNRLTSQFTAKGEYSEALGYEFAVALTNIASSY